MEEQTPMEDTGCNCTCSCDCACHKNESLAKAKEAPEGERFFWQMRLTDTVGSSFLGILAILLLVFLVRSNKRNRELLLEVISLHRQP